MTYRDEHPILASEQGCYHVGFDFKTIRRNYLNALVPGSQIFEDSPWTFTATHWEMTDWTVVDETGGEVLALDMISGTGDALVRVQITNITIEFSVIRVSS